MSIVRHESEIHTDPKGIQQSHHHNTRVLIVVVLIAIAALTYFLMRGARVVERVSGK
jgi:small neutral amino acid transporter SnatA (MarC family)